MKKIAIPFLMLAALVGSASSVCSKQVAERIDDKIVVYEKPIVAEHVGVPKEVPTDIALKIINGEQPEYAKKTGTKEVTESLLPPPAKITKNDEYRVWTYNASEKKWSDNKRTGPPRIATSWALSFSLLWPIAIIFLISVINGFRNRSSWRLVGLGLVFAGSLYLQDELQLMTAVLGLKALMAVLAVLFSPSVMAAYAAGLDTKSTEDTNASLAALGLASFFALALGFHLPVGGSSHSAYLQCEWVIGIASALGLVISGAIKKFQKLIEGGAGLSPEDLEDHTVQEK